MGPVSKDMEKHWLLKLPTTSNKDTLCLPAQQLSSSRRCAAFRHLSLAVMLRLQAGVKLQLTLCLTSQAVCVIVHFSLNRHTL